MFDLSAVERVCKFRVLRGEKKFYLFHFLRQPTRDEWKEYFKSKGFVGYSKGSGTFEVSNTSQEDDATFWDNLITKVEGYSIGTQPVMELPEWKTKIPLQHKLDAVASLMVFNRSNAPVEEAVAATEGFDLSENGALTDLVFSLIHNGDETTVTFSFMSPDSSDYVKYNRMATKMKLTRTRQRNVSAVTSPVNLDASEALFDKLITKAVGYSFNGKDIIGQENWKSLIPVYHKREAVRELFSGSLKDDDSD